MNEIKIFNNPQFGDIRTTGNIDTPVFCLSDLCRVLDLQTSAVTRRLEKDVISSHPLQTAGGIQQACFVNEDGMYDVILDSRKPEAKAFRKWITSEVLPAIRKTGGYIVAKEEDTPELIMARALMVAKEAIDRQAQRLEHQEQVLKLQEHTIKEQAPKVEYFDSVLDSKRLIAINVIANDLGITAIKLNRFLLENKVIYQVNGCFVLCAKYRNQDLAHTKTHRYTDSHGNIQTAEHLYWTEKGREMITRMYQQFKKAS